MKALEFSYPTKAAPAKSTKPVFRALIDLLAHAKFWPVQRIAASPARRAAFSASPHPTVREARPGAISIFNFWSCLALVF